MIVINIIEASDKQLQMLVNKASRNGYNKWISGRDFTVESIKENKCEVIYLENDFTVTYSSLNYTIGRFEDKIITIQEYIAMKKSDLKPGMVVEYANGHKRLVIDINGKLCLVGREMFSELTGFNDNLTNEYNPCVTIVKVYQPKEPTSFSALLECKNCIWERPKETVLTMQEIADKFGIPVEQLKIKK